MQKLLILFFILSYSLHSQNLSLFDIDPAGFPTIKGKFYNFDQNGKQVIDFNPSDFSLFENGIERIITKINCPGNTDPVELSSVFVIDYSCLMSNGIGPKIETAKFAANLWIDQLNEKSESAIVTFNCCCYLSQDFTNNKLKLKNCLSNIKQPFGGSDINSALIDGPCSGLRVAETGKNKRIIVLLSTGVSYSEIKVDEIINFANQNEISIYSIILENYASDDIKKITKETGGIFFENVKSIDDVDGLYFSILSLSQQIKPCEIEWTSEYACNTYNTLVKLKKNNDTASSEYLVPDNGSLNLSIVPKTLNFGPIEPGKKVNKIIKLSAQNSDILVNNIKIKYGSNVFKIPNINYPFLIPKNSEKNISVEFEPIDSSRNYSLFEIELNNCNYQFSVFGGFQGKPFLNQTLKLTSPNGGEEFLVGSDTLITWEGVSEYDEVSIQYSIDGGINWNLINGEAKGLKEIWHNIPKPTSNKCLIKVSLGNKSTEPEIAWQKCFGGTSREQPLSTIPTLDGGFIMAGTTSSKNGDVTGYKDSTDIWVVKTDFSGKIEWQKCYGDTGLDEANQILETKDGGYIIAGGISSKISTCKISSEGRMDIWILKIDKLGNIQWDKKFNELCNETAYCIQETKDGGYVVGCEITSNNYTVYKLNSNGDSLWRKDYEDNSMNHLRSIRETVDGGFILAGSSLSALSKDYYMRIVKISNSGDLEWEKKYGGTSIDQAFSIEITGNDGYIIVGNTLSNDKDVSGNHGNYDAWVLKIDLTGNIEWQKCYGGTGNDRFWTIKCEPDGGYIAAGRTDSKDGDVKGNHGSFDLWVVKIDQGGNIKWQKCLGGSSNEQAFSIFQTKDGEYITAGDVGSDNGDVEGHHGEADFWLVKLSSTGSNMEDMSDAVFSIVEPIASSVDIDMKKCLVGDAKDSVITDFVYNVGNYKVKINTIFFSGPDANAFTLASGIPEYEIVPSKTHYGEFLFIPNRVGIHTATMNIITQSDTLKQTIIGEGVEQVFQVFNGVLDFGKVELGFDRVIQDTILFTNISSKPIYITNTLLMTPDLEQFNIISGGGGFTLNPGNSRKLTLQFKPKYVGRISGRLRFEYEGIGAPAEVQLFGEGINVNGVKEAKINSKNHIMSIAPNPAGNEIDLEFSTNEIGFTEIALYNTLGEIVLTAFSEDISETGKRIIKINSSEIGNGTYTVIFKSPTVIDTKQIMIVK